VLGPTAVQLGTAATSLPNRLPARDFEVGVIAGTAASTRSATALIRAANDGTVSVASTQLAGMRDFIELPVSHTFIMRNADGPTDARVPARRPLRALTFRRGAWYVWRAMATHAPLSERLEQLRRELAASASLSAGDRRRARAADRGRARHVELERTSRSRSPTASRTPRATSRRPTRA
jgi:hypothetical protein